jgi:NodT family efflux transporter outer membrane factor (OMF) lipoprotein
MYAASREAGSNLRIHPTRRCRRRLASAACAGLLATAGCAVGPDFKRPESPAQAGFAPTPLPAVTESAPVHGGEAERLVLGQDISADWWTVFRSPALNELVKTALAANPSIEAAQAALRGAQFNVYAQLGFFAPTLSAGYSFERQQLAGNEGGNAPGLQGNGTVIAASQTPGVPPFTQPVTYNLHTAQLTVGYTPDVFGGNIRQVESLRAQSQYQRFQLEAAYITLASNVVAAALQEALLRAQIAAAEDIIRVNEEGLRILQHQSTVGYAMRMDVAAQEAALAQARGNLPPLQKQLEQTRDLIRALAGNLPNQDVPETFTLDGLHLPEALPLSLSSKLIEQRPDIRAAEEQLHAASAQVGVAVAARLPLFNISAADGGVATVFSQMFANGGPFWNLTLATTVPLFDGFTLYNHERSARAALRQAAAQYRSTVITAFQNVADTLHAIMTDDKTLAAAVAAEQAAKVSLDVTSDQNRAGYTNYLALLTAEQAYQQALTTRVQAQAARFGDAAALYQALGGGWWNRDQMASGTGGP